LRRRYGIGEVRTAKYPSRGNGGEIVTPIKTIFEFGEVAGYMLVTDGAVSVGDGTLELGGGFLLPSDLLSTSCGPAAPDNMTDEALSQGLHDG